MGKRGPQPKPVSVKRLEGNPGKGKLVDPAPEVDISAGDLGEPAEMRVAAQDIWREVVGSFPEWYFTAADRPILQLYCQQLARIQLSERAMMRQPTIVKRANGSPCLNPHLRIISETTPLVLKLAEKLGITREKRFGLARAPHEPPSGHRPEPISAPDGGEPEDGFEDLIAPPIAH